MKRVRKLIKLTNLQAEGLDEKGLIHVFGGIEPKECSCSCFYEACGGSTRADNDSANLKHGYSSPLPDMEDPNWGIVPPT
ncbi:MAG: rSAM-modified peptide [Candidatus Aminicenantes bacterium]|nr:MAG: rSAM-modified peptide [Candidatus Aminicenantes bacterium]